MLLSQQRKVAKFVRCITNFHTIDSDIKESLKELDKAVSNAQGAYKLDVINPLMNHISILEMKNLSHQARFHLEWALKIFDDTKSDTCGNYTKLQTLKKLGVIENYLQNFQESKSYLGFTIKGGEYLMKTKKGIEKCGADFNETHRIQLRNLAHPEEIIKYIQNLWKTGTYSTSSEGYHELIQEVITLLRTCRKTGFHLEAEETLKSISLNTTWRGKVSDDLKKLIDTQLLMYSSISTFHDGNWQDSLQSSIDYMNNVDQDIFEMLPVFINLTKIYAWRGQLEDLYPILKGILDKTTLRIKRIYLLSFLMHLTPKCRVTKEETTALDTELTNCITDHVSEAVPHESLDWMYLLPAESFLKTIRYLREGKLEAAWSEISGMIDFYIEMNDVENAAMMTVFLCETVFIPLKMPNHALDMLSWASGLLNPHGYSHYTCSQQFLNGYVSMTCGIVQMGLLNDFSQALNWFHSAMWMVEKSPYNVPAEYRILSNIATLDSKSDGLLRRDKIKHMLGLKEKVKTIIYF